MAAGLWRHCLSVVEIWKLKAGMWYNSRRKKEANMEKWNFGRIASDGFVAD